MFPAANRGEHSANSFYKETIPFEAFTYYFLIHLLGSVLVK